MKASFKFIQHEFQGNPKWLYEITSTEACIYCVHIDAHPSILEMDLCQYFHIQ